MKLETELIWSNCMSLEYEFKIEWRFQVHSRFIDCPISQVSPQGFLQGIWSSLGMFKLGLYNWPTGFSPLKWTMKVTWRCLERYSMEDPFVDSPMISPFWRGWITRGFQVRNNEIFLPRLSHGKSIHIIWLSLFIWHNSWLYHVIPMV